MKMNSAFLRAALLAPAMISVSSLSLRADHRTLYLAAQTGIYRIHLNIAGAGALSKPAVVAGTSPSW